jgi:hypothetical protein
MNIRVFIDNKPSDLYGSSVAEALKQIPAEEVDKVEVITSPSAKYEAEGADAVINIITKRSKFNGTNGNVRANIRTLNKELSSGLKVRKNSMSYNIDLGVYYYHYRSLENMLRNDLNTQKATTLSQLINRENRSGFYSAAFNMVKELDSLKTFSAGFRFRDGMVNNTNSTFNNYSIDDVSYSRYYRNFDIGGGNTGYSINAGYTAKSKNKKNEMNMLAAFFDYNGHENYDLEQLRNYMVDHIETSRSRMQNRELALQADGVFPFNGQAKIEVGARSVFRYFSNSNQIDVYNFDNKDFMIDDIRSTGFGYRRAIHAAYLNYSFAVQQWELRVGGRFELTTLQVDFKNNALTVPDYNNFVPDFLISRKISKLHAIRFSYKKNIQRPYLHHLNPNVNYMDSLNVSFGNPYLVPAVQHGYQLVHSFTKQPFSWTNTFFLNNNRNNVESVTTLKANGVAETTYQNIGRLTDAGIMTSFSMNRQTGFSFSVSGNLRYVYIVSKALQQKNDGFTYGTNLNVSYRFNKSFSVEGNARLNSKTITLQEYETRWKQHGISINKKFFGEKLNVTAGSDDFLSRYQSIKSVIRSKTVVQYSDWRYPSRIFRIGITYAFGRKDLKLHEGRQAGGEEN